MIQCRWVCKHYGEQKASQLKRKRGIRQQKCILPCNCKMHIHVTYCKITQKYIIRSVALEHNHPHGEAEFSTYATSRRLTGELRDQVQMLLDQGANAQVVTQYVQAQGKQIIPRDVYNMRQKLTACGMHTCVVAQRCIR